VRTGQPATCAQRLTIDDDGCFLDMLRAHYVLKWWSVASGRFMQFTPSANFGKSVSPVTIGACRLFNET
jgi:hypothetical protein